MPRDTTILQQASQKCDENIKKRKVLNAKLERDNISKGMKEFFKEQRSNDAMHYSTVKVKKQESNIVKLSHLRKNNII